MRGGWVVLLFILPLAAVQAGPSDLVARDVLVPAGAARDDFFGSAIATAGDWMAVGAPGQGSGTIHIYHLTGGAWKAVHEIPARSSSTPVSNYGSVLEMSGIWLFVGVPASDTVDVYHRVDDEYTYHETLRGSGGMRFGYSLAAAGNELLVGAPGQVEFNPFAAAGSVFHFRVKAGDWLQTRVLSQGGFGEQRQFGAAVDFDGTHLIIGAPARQIEDYIFPGYAWAYELRNGAWSTPVRLDPFTIIDEYGTFGWTVAVHQGHAFVGSTPDITIYSGSFTGGVYAFAANAGAWSGEQAWNFEARAIDLHGNLAGFSWLGSSYVSIMERVNTRWLTAASLRGSVSTQFGTAIDVRDDSVLIGAPFEDQIAQNAGAVWVFADNLGPIADAGPDQALSVEGKGGKVTVRLDGSGSYDPDGEIESWTWRIGSKNVAGPIVDVELGAGSYTYRLTVRDEHGFSSTDTVRISISEVATLEAGFSFTPNNRPPGTLVDFRDLSKTGAGVIINWEWDFDGDGTTDATARRASHVYAESGKYAAKLTVDDHLGKRSSFTRTVTVSNAPPVAHAGADVVVAEGAGGTATVELDGGGSNDPDGSISSYTWMQGNVQVGNSQTVSVTAPRGVTEYTLRVRDNGGLTAIDTVRVLVTPTGANATAHNEAPKASFDWTAAPKVVRGIEFSSTATDGEGPIALWAWDFDADGSSDAEVATLTKTLGYGEHRVTLTVTDMEGEADSTVKEVRVENAAPTASFHPLELKEVPLGAPVVFTDLSTDPEREIMSWQWDFGDGRTSQHTDIGHMFDTAGKHPITLTITDAGGARSTIEGSVTVLDVGEAGANWTQEEALAAQERGERLFPEPIIVDDDKAPDDVADEETDEAPSGGTWEIVRKARDEATLPFSWWWIAVLAAILVLVIVAVRQRR